RVMASGGAMSPGDELDTTQYTVEEMQVAVDEARAAGKYVLAHAYSSSAVRNALHAGVRSIEHGNLIDEAGAREIRKAGGFLLPALGASQTIWGGGQSDGDGGDQLEKNHKGRGKNVRAPGPTH